VPDTAKRPVLTLVELDQVGGSSTVNELCNDYLRYVKNYPDLFRDQCNPLQRLELIREAFGTRPAAGARLLDIEDWLDTLERRSTRSGGRQRKAAEASFPQSDTGLFCRPSTYMASFAIMSQATQFGMKSSAG
jgi:hypothetical protein